MIRPQRVANDHTPSFVSVFCFNRTLNSELRFLLSLISKQVGLSLKSGYTCIYLWSQIRLIPARKCFAMNRMKGESNPFCWNPFFDSAWSLDAYTKRNEMVKLDENGFEDAPRSPKGMDSVHLFLKRSTNFFALVFNQLPVCATSNNQNIHSNYELLIFSNSIKRFDVEWHNSIICSLYTL